MSNETGFFLWLVPESEAYEGFSDCIGMLSHALGTPRFSPHVTLQGSHFGRQEVLEERAEGISGRIPPVRFRPAELIRGKDYFHRFFVRLEVDPAVLEMRVRLFPLEADTWLPHLSLVYGHAAELREPMLTSLMSGMRFKPFDIVLLRLVRGGRDPSKWRTVGEWPLAGRLGD